MKKSENKIKSEAGDPLDSLNSVDEKRFKITLIVAIIAIIMAFIGGFASVYYQNWVKTQTTAKLIYDDMDRMNWSLSNYNTAVIALNDTPSVVPYFISPIYPNDGIYYSSRSDIASLDSDLARNISIFYSDLQWAELYRGVINEAIQNSNNTRVNSTEIYILNPKQSYEISIARNQLINGILDANVIRSQIMDDLEKKYGIPKNPPNRFNRYP